MAKVWLITGSGNGLSDGISSLTSPCGSNRIFHNECGESANSGAVGPRRVAPSCAHSRTLLFANGSLRGASMIHSNVTEKGDSYELPTFGQQRTSSFRSSARHDDLRRGLGLGFGKGRGTKGVRRFPRGRRQFHRHRELLHQRDERIVPRRVYGGPPPESRDGNEIQPC